MLLSPQPDDLLMGREGCAFKSHVPKVYGLTEGWKKLLTLHRMVLTSNISIKLGLESWAVIEKMCMENKKFGSAGNVAIGKQPESSRGNARCLDLMLLNSWSISRSLFGS